MKKKKKKNILKSIVLGILFAYLFVTSLIGTTAIYNLYIGGFKNEPDRMFTIGGFHVFMNNLIDISRIEEKKAIKNITDDMVKDCQNENCKIATIYNNLSTFEYEHGTNLDPLTIWKEKSADCDEISHLNEMMLESQGVEAHMVCNNFHCWNVIITNGTKYQIDLTYPYIEVIE